jgi:hypothetical protein
MPAPEASLESVVATQASELVGSDEGYLDQFGGSVALNGDTAIVGAPQHTVGSSYDQGAAYVFAKSGTGWSQQGELIASDGTHSTLFGSSVAVDSTTALVGATLARNSFGVTTGAVYVFVRNGSSWTQEAKLLASDGVDWDQFGSSVALSGSTAIIGANNKANGRGEAYVFVQNGTTWTEQQQLVANDAVEGDDFGSGVSVLGDTAFVGAAGKNAYQGATYVFGLSGGVWLQQSELVALDGAAGDDFGVSVSLGASTALVGASGKTFGQNTNQGAAYVFTQQGGAWSQQSELVASDGQIRDYFGVSVALSGATALVGADGVLSGQGVGYVFVQNGATWSQQA